MKKILFPLLFVGLLGGAVAVCDSDPNGLADGDPYIIGLIEDVRDGGNFEVTLVVADLVEPPDLPRLILHVADTTAVLVEESDGSIVPGDAEDLTVGSSIRAWTTGIEFTSETPQYIATRIEVMRSD